MIFSTPLSRNIVLSTVAAVLLLFAGQALAEQCENALDMDQATRTSIENAGLQYFGYLSHGDAASLQRNAVGSLAANFAGVQNAVMQNQQILANGQAATRATYLLDAAGSGTLPQAEFLCGIWGTPQFVSFTLNNLPAGRYGLVIEDVKTTKGPYYVSFVLQQEQQGGPWKLAGFPPPEPAEVLGHDAPWYLTQARAFKQKGELHDAWFYYQQARLLADPLPFMSTTPVVKLDREADQSKPSDLPLNGPVPLPAQNGKTYSVTQEFPVIVENGMDLVVKYSSPDISDTAKTFSDNSAVIKAIVTKYPEYRDIFEGVVARAVDPTGHDYGTLLAMKDIK